jgi:hypothetical protein
MLLHNIHEGESFTLKSTLGDIRHNNISVCGGADIFWGLDYVTQVSTLGNMTTGDSVDKSLRSIFEHTHCWYVLSYVEGIHGII